VVTVTGVNTTSSLPRGWERVWRDWLRAPGLAGLFCGGGGGGGARVREEVCEWEMVGAPPPGGEETWAW